MSSISVPDASTLWCAMFIMCRKSVVCTTCTKCATCATTYAIFQIFLLSITVHIVCRELVVFITAAIHFHLKWFLKQKEIIKIKNCYFTYKKVFFSRNKNLFFCSVSGLGSRPWWTEWPGPASGQPKMHNRIRINRDQDL